MRSFARWSHRVAAITLWGLVIVVVGALIGHGETLGQEPNRAGLVIDFGNGRIERRCIEFSEDEISGAELLQRSGIPVVMSGFGGLGSGVCRIDDTGCSDPGDCFCQCRGADCHYWSYWVLQDGEWRYQSVGASQRDVRDGDVDVWVWGPGRSLPPGIAPTSEVCEIAEPTAAPPATSPPTVGPPPWAGSGPTPAAGATPEGEAAGSAATPTAGSVAGATPRATAEARGTAQARRPFATPDGGGDIDAAAADDEGSGVPVGLIAFGAVAGALVLVTGALALRRRLRG